MEMKVVELGFLADLVLKQKDLAEKGIDQKTLDSLFPLPTQTSAIPTPVSIRTHQTVWMRDDENDNKLFSSPEVQEQSKSDRKEARVLHVSLFKEHYGNPAPYTSVHDSSSSSSSRNESSSDSDF